MYKKTTMYALALLALLGTATLLSACEDWWGEDHEGGRRGGRHHEDGGRRDRGDRY